MTPEQTLALKADEGLKPRIYDDSTGLAIVPGSVVEGHPTIGRGRACDVHGITEAEADYLFANDLVLVSAEIDALPWAAALDPVRRGVIEQLAFNMGVPNLRGFVRMIACVKAENWTGAAAELMQSKWAGQVQPERRSRLVAELLTGTLDGVSGAAVA